MDCMDGPWCPFESYGVVSFMALWPATARPSIGAVMMPMCRFRRAGFVLVAAVCCLGAWTVSAWDSATALVLMHSDVTASTSLRVSGSVLRIEPGINGATGPVVVGTIDYRAAARTRANGEVVLTVDTSADLDAVIGAAPGTDSGIAFAGSGDGALAGVLHRDAPQVAGRWVGSGVRAGQMVFTLNGAAAASGATVPLRFVLSLP